MRRRRARRNTGNLLNQVPAEVKQVARNLRSAGASVRTNLVGGAVVDLIQGRTPKDWDIEVFGVSPEQLLTLAQRMGTASEVGRAFGIVKLALPSGLDLDLSVPRIDNKVGVGHTGFAPTFVPNMTNREAARRRDFTINSLAVDLKTGSLIDPFGGLKDLHDGVLRATDPVLFVQDPVRALRGMQLLARKAKTVHPDTIKLIRGMRANAEPMAPERVLEEWRKLLLKADRPSVGLEYLRETGYLEDYPELAALEHTPQHPDWHPEGDVWIHTKQIADAAAQTRHRVPERQREGFVFGALLHDIGKPLTTVRPEDVEAGRFPKERLFTAWAHDVKGKAPARAFMERLRAPKKTTALTEALVGEHMQPYTLRSGGAGRAAYARLARRVRRAGGDLQTLAVLSQCDACATGQGRHFHLGEPDWEHQVSQNLLTWAEDVDTPAAAKPLVQGRDLIKLGHRPGPQFGVILDFARSLQDTGMGREGILEEVATQYPAPPRKNPSNARENAWTAVVAQIAKHPAVQQAALEIASKVGKKGWARLMAMSVEERADWLEGAGAKASWLTGPLSRLVYSKGKRFRRVLLLQISGAMADPAIQKEVLRAGKAGYTAARTRQSAPPRTNPKLYGSLPAASWAESEIRREGFHSIEFLGKERSKDGPVLIYEAGKGRDECYRLNVGRFRGQDRLHVRAFRLDQ